jgi:hypothetical protein
VNAIIEPIFNRIYDEVLKEKLLYLEMSAVQLRRIVEILTMMTPIMKETAGQSRDIQIRVLIHRQRVLLLTLIPGPFPDANPKKRIRANPTSSDDSFNGYDQN